MSYRFLSVDKREAKALKKLSRELEVTEAKVFLLALAFYQICRSRGYFDEVMLKEWKKLRGESS